MEETIFDNPHGVGDIRYLIGKTLVSASDTNFVLDDGRKFHVFHDQD